MKYYCQLARNRGHVSKNPLQLYSDDFYTLVMKNSDINKGVRKNMENRPGPTFKFNSVTERNNFIEYLKTDFVRFCLSFYKIKADTDCGEMKMIPWLDFTQSWNDEKLYKLFEIDKVTQEYIREFLPDYYEIRKTMHNQVL